MPLAITGPHVCWNRTTRSSSAGADLGADVVPDPAEDQVGDEVQRRVVVGREEVAGVLAWRR